MRVKVTTGFLLSVLLLASGPAPADERPAPADGFRVLSWNIAGNAFVSRPAAFQALLRRAAADILLLDEVSPAADAGLLRKVLEGVQPAPVTGRDDAWQIDFGASGGRQRGVIASRMAMEPLAEFSSIVPYPEDDRQYLLQQMSPRDHGFYPGSLDGGIPVNGAAILVAQRRLLVVVADLQCCGDGPGSWQEYRRRVEAREIRRRIRQVLARVPVDGVILAGDFNLVNSAFPLALLAGPYPPPHAGLIPAEVYHLDGVATWTWDGRGTPYPSRALDFQLYGSAALGVGAGVILDTEDIPAGELGRYDLLPATSGLLSDHRPVVVDYVWD